MTDASVHRWDPSLLHLATLEPQEHCARGSGASKPAFDTQLLHGCLLHGVVDAPDLFLRQRALHVAIGDAVAVAGPVCPGGQERKAVSTGWCVSAGRCVSVGRYVRV